MRNESDDRQELIDRVDVHALLLGVQCDTIARLGDVIIGLQEDVRRLDKQVRAAGNVMRRRSRHLHVVADEAGEGG